MGRPTKRTPTVEELIIEGIKAGLTYRLAASRAGIADSTLRDWLKRGDEGDGQFAAFSAAVRRAEAEGALTALQNIDRAARTDWRAAAWLLEHRHPDDYGPKNKLQLQGDLEAPLTIHVVYADPADPDAASTP